MTFKQTKFLILLAFVSMSSACSLFPFSSQNKATPLENTKATEANATTPSALGEDEQSQASPEQLLASSLHAQVHAYKAQNEVLSPELLNKISSIFATYQSGDIDKSQQDMQKLLQNELQLTSPVYVLAGDIDLATKKTSSAIEHYKKALSINKYNPKAANRLGRLYREQGEFTLALAMYTQAIESYPSHVVSYRNRAVLNDLYLNNKEQALADYQAYAALLDYQLNTDPLANGESLSESQEKALKKDIKLAKRWLSDLGRQVKALKKSQNASLAGGV